MQTQVRQIQGVARLLGRHQRADRRQRRHGRLVRRQGGRPRPQLHHPANNQRRREKNPAVQNVYKV